jgi:hypothetical protein
MDDGSFAPSLSSEFVSAYRANVVSSVISWLCDVLPVIIAIRYGGDYTVWISSVRALLVSTDVIMHRQCYRVMRAHLFDEYQLPTGLTECFLLFLGCVVSCP